MRYREWNKCGSVWKFLTPGTDSIDTQKFDHIVEGNLCPACLPGRILIKESVFMTAITNHMPTAELQALDGAHHMHPFTNNADLAAKGARIITRAKGVTLTDSEGHDILDAMAGLWCVNIGYGRDELADVAAPPVE